MICEIWVFGGSSHCATRIEWTGPTSAFRFVLVLIILMRSPYVIKLTKTSISQFISLRHTESWRIVGFRFFNFNPYAAVFNVIKTEQLGGILGAVFANKYLEYIPPAARDRRLETYIVPSGRSRC
jgi:hypothetical protein